MANKPSDADVHSALPAAAGSQDPGTRVRLRIRIQFQFESGESDPGGRGD